MRSRTVVAAISSAAAFAMFSGMMILGMQKPMRPLDYFLSGAVGTFAALIALFLTLVPSGEWGSFFVKKQRLPKRPDGARQGSGGGRNTLGI